MIAVHFGVGAVVQEKFGLFARSHLRAVHTAVAAEFLGRRIAFLQLGFGFVFDGGKRGRVVFLPKSLDFVAVKVPNSCRYGDDKNKFFHCVMCKTVKDVC